jgi:transcriptional regulator with XRE-family HTH domain
MNQNQSRRLGQFLRHHRKEHGLTVRDLAKNSGVDRTAIVRIENGSVAAPRPDTLRALAQALAIPLADVFALADYVVPDELPTFGPYLQAKYHDLPPEAVAQLDSYFQHLAQRHHLDLGGPADGEDEHDITRPSRP